MSRPRLLDLFCGAGGAAMGYHRAGFDVVGVDIKPQRRYPFEFHQADALTYPLDGFDVIHASPPCQGYSIMRNLPWLRDREYPLLIEPVRERLAATGRPYVIENVMGAKLAANWLCGAMFGLPFYRHRLFETNWFWLAPAHPRHEGVIQRGRLLGARARTHIVRANGFTAGFDQPHTRVLAGHPSRAGVHRVGDAMGIEWMTGAELSQAIPPAYTEYLGRFLLQAVLTRSEDYAAVR